MNAFKLGVFASLSALGAHGLLNEFKPATATSATAKTERASQP